ncbi:MAG: Fe-S cluster assembly protein SufD [bacterium]
MSAPALPTKKTPGWEFTDLEGLDDAGFTPAQPGEGDARERATAPLTVPEGSVELVQVDGGCLNGSAATTGDAPSEPTVCSLEAAREAWPNLIGERLGTLVDSNDPFVARNDENWRGGAFVYVPKGQRLEGTVGLEAIQSSRESALSYRTLIILEEAAEAEVWEQWLTAEGLDDTIFNTVTEIFVGPAANLRYVNAQHLTKSGWVFASQRAEVEREGSLDWVSLGFGGGGGKVRMDTRLAGRGSDAKVTGAYAGNGSQHLDFDTTQVHGAPSTTSDLAFRGVLADTATSVWRGMIRVEPGAQQTDAFQESRNLLLSREAHSDAIPGLEIEADDVRCTHAAAVAQLDPEQLHYLRSRGLPEESARKVVIEGFLESLVERLSDGPVREQVSDALENRLGEILV